MYTDIHISKRELSDCRRILGDVFKSVKFSSPRIRQRLYDSYLSNIVQLIEYAHENNLDSRSHIRGIEPYLREYAHKKRHRRGVTRSR